MLRLLSRVRFPRSCHRRPLSSAASGAVNSAQHHDETNFDELIDELSSTAATEPKSFAQLFKNSKFVQLGDFDGRVVVGKVVHRVLTDLYIDFGGKFNAVCKVPDGGEKDYLVGCQVVLRLHDPELSERFLGSRYDLTLLEADATLLGLYRNRRSAKTADDTMAEAKQAPEKPVSESFESEETPVAPEKELKD